MATIQDLPQEVVLPLVESLSQSGFNSLTVAMLSHMIRDDKEAPELINHTILENVLKEFDKVAEFHVKEIKDKLLGQLDDEQLSEELTQLSISTLDMVKDNIRQLVTDTEET